MQPETFIVRAHVGSSVVLDCYFTNTATVEWSAPSSAVCSEYDITGGTLNISKLEPSQAGDYVCSETNDTDTKVFSLEVTGIVVFSLKD